MLSRPRIRHPDLFRAEAEALAGTDDLAAFRATWPLTVAGLQLLHKLTPAIPGLGWIVGHAIPLLLATGDAAFEALTPAADTREQMIALHHDYEPREGTMEPISLIFRILTLLMPIIQQVMKEIMDEHPAAGEAQGLYQAGPSDEELYARLRAKL